jgi:hypothetical protein
LTAPIIVRNPEKTAKPLNANRTIPKEESNRKRACGDRFRFHLKKFQRHV